MKSKKFSHKNIIKVFFVILGMGILIPSGFGFSMKNPGAVYCKEMGYQWEKKETELGEIGICRFSSTKSCPAHEFLQGKCGKEYSYCAKKGYPLKTLRDSEKCASVPFFSECAVCVLETGKEVEVTKLMGLSFREGVCGDGRCVLGENYKTCPEDCPSGSGDLFCDKVRDGKCDPDCTPQTDLDCQCGDNICESHENYKTCPEDCSSGGYDGYCDKVKDGICDPDCKPGQDEDCKKTRFLVYLAIIISTAAGGGFIGWLIYQKIKRKSIYGG